MLRSRGTNGIATSDLAFPAEDGGTALLVPLSDDDGPDVIEDRLSGAHAGWVDSRALSSAALRQALRRAEDGLAGSGIVAQAGGIAVAGSWRVSRPKPVLFFTARGSDAHPQRLRLEVSIEYDLARSLERVVDRHLAAASVAAEREVAGIVGTVDEIALTLMTEARIDLADVVDALTRRRKVEFRCGSSQRAGWFRWRDFAISAETDDRGSLSLDGNVLTIANQTTADTLMLACHGKPLSAVVEQDFLPPDTVVEEVAQSKLRGLLVTLRSQELPFGSGMEAGLP